MRRTARRRILGVSLLLAVSLLAGSGYALLDVSLQPVGFWSGWLLAGLIGSLALLNLRKKLSVVRAGSASAWMQFHTYVGLFAVLVFVAHSGLDLPQGGLEVLLAILFALVSGTGVAGLLLSRLVPLRLAGRDEVLFERIPQHLRKLRDEVEELVVVSAKEVQGSVIAEFYEGRLAPYFQKPRHALFHWLDSERPLQRMDRELRAMERYTSPREREILSEIGDRVRRKHELDFHHAHQLALKGWLFAHIPLTWALLITAALHALMVHGFRSATP